MTRVAELRRRQTDLLCVLRQAGANGFARAALQECTKRRCGRDRCREACAFGMARHRRQAAQTVMQDFATVDAPLFEVRLSHNTWGRPAGNLADVNLETIKKLIRRGLDRSLNTRARAVGTINVSMLGFGEEGMWRIEAHFIVAGVDREAIYKALTPRGKNQSDFFHVSPVNDLENTAGRLFRHTVKYWRHPDDPRPAAPAKSSALAEYYTWLLSMPTGHLTIRYGYDRYFLQLPEKLKAVKVAKPRRKRSADHLAKYRFGSEYWEQRRLNETLAKEH